MNKRAIILLTICFVLAVASLTIRYIEQEKESIKKRFIGETPTEERTAGSASSSRMLPLAPPVEGMPTPVKQEPNATPLSDTVKPPSAGTIPPGPRSSPNSLATADKKPLNTTAIDDVRGKSVEREKKSSAGQPLNTPLEEVSTPLGPEVTSEVSDTVNEPEGGTGLDAQEVKATGAEGKKVPAAGTVSAGDDAKPVAAAEQPEKVIADGGSGEQDEVQKDAVVEDAGDDQGDERMDGGELPEGEEVVEEDQLPEEGEALPEEAEDQVEEGDAAAEEEKEDTDEVE